MRFTNYLIFLWFVLIFIGLFVKSSTAEVNKNPYRVLLVVGDQWQDPMSYMIKKPKEGIENPSYPDSADYSGYANTPHISRPTDFHSIVVLLKSWGIPFDIVRLDQQFLNRNMFLGADGKPRYGTIIWDVNQSDNLLDPNYSIVKNMVAEYGMGFIALANRIHPPTIQSVLGLKYQGAWMSEDRLKVVKQHFLTENLKSPLDGGGNKQRIQVKVKEAKVLVRQGDYPQVTVRSYPSGGHVAWIGGDYNAMFDSQSIRDLFRRAITWSIGYSIYKRWDNDIIMIMDDPGTAQNVWLKSWHYPTLSKETIENYLIDPLQKHDAVLNINIVSGFVNEEKEWVEPTWQQNFVDEFGTRQNYVSTKKGIDKGLELGVFEVMCHGLTHMQPDLTEWWDSDLDREKAEVGWYREFGDTRRGKEIPAAEQLWRMKTAKRWIENQFGVTPLEFCAGGNGTSVTYTNNSWRIAGRAGFGWMGRRNWVNSYLGQDMVIVNWKYYGTHDAPLFVLSPPDGHDRGITMEPEKFADIFEEYPNGHFININEFIGHLHASNGGNLINEQGSIGINLKVKYDDHYCRYFKNNNSEWTVGIADWLLDRMNKSLAIKIDGEVVMKDSTGKLPYKISINEGLGIHTIQIE